MRRTALLRWVALTSIFVMVFALAPSFASAEEMYFTAVNDDLLSLEEATMPYKVNDQFYVPYTIFNDKALGVYYSYNKDIYKLTFYNKNNTLIFDLLMSVAYNDEQQYRQRVISRNGTLYIPIEFVCSQFGLGFTHINAAPITIIRVVSSSNLDSIAFRQRNSSKMTEEYINYTGGGSASPTRTPVTTVSPTQTYAPGISQPPFEPDPQKVYLAFSDCVGDELYEVLNVLDSRDISGSFFFSAGVIDDNGDAIRRAFGTGHAVCVQGTSVEELDSANSALERQIQTKTRVVRLIGYGNDAPDELSAAVVDAGYSIWVEDVLLAGAEGVTGKTISQDAHKYLRPGADPVMLVFEGLVQADVLKSVLTYVGNVNYNFRRATQGHTFK